MNIVQKRLHAIFLGTRFYPIKIIFDKYGSTIWSTRIRFKNAISIKNNVDKERICIEDIYGVYILGKPATVMYTIDCENKFLKKLYWVPENKIYLGTWKYPLEIDVTEDIFEEQLVRKIRSVFCKNINISKHVLIIHNFKKIFRHRLIVEYSIIEERKETETDYDEIYGVGTVIFGDENSTKYHCIVKINFIQN